jgi:hypothetical protein
MSDTWTAAERDAYHRQQDAARAAYDRLRCASLRGNDVLAAAVRAHWEPFRRYQQESSYERREDPIRESPCCELVN